MNCSWKLKKGDLNEVFGTSQDCICLFFHIAGNLAN